MRERENINEEELQRTFLLEGKSSKLIEGTTLYERVRERENEEWKRERESKWRTEREG